MTTGAKYDLFIEQGADFKRSLTLKDGTTPVEVSRYAARLQIKANPIDTEPLLTLDSSVDGIVIDETIDLSITSEQTSLLPADILYYDLFINTGDEVQRLLYGKVYVQERVTQWLLT